MSDRHRELVESILDGVDVEIGGDRPWDIRVNDPAFFTRLLAEGSLGLGESYMDGWWDCDELDEAFGRVFAVGAQSRVPRTWKTLFSLLQARFLNRQNKKRAFIPAEAHYDLGNEIFEATFDTRLTGSCGYWKEATDLDSAQEAKHDLICRKLNLQPGQRVLDFGCGWGAFMKYAAEHYGVECEGVTVSKEQVAWGKEKCEGLPVTFHLTDYREVRGEFDHAVSMGMFEHVGYRNYRVYMETVNRCLKGDGLFLLHTIGSNYSTTNIEPWLDKYIFPNGVLPSIAQLGGAMEKLFVVEDWHNFGADYDKTLCAWMDKFDDHWPKLADHYDERFYRMWRYYLLSCAGAFRGRWIQLWQLVLSKRGVPGGYATVR
jgi:cyclopropane-fatty-acyl-phospholipid synthase